MEKNSFKWPVDYSRFMLQGESNSRILHWN